MLASYRVHEISSRDALTPGLSVLRTKVFRSLIACKTFYHQTCTKTSPILLFGHAALSPRIPKQFLIGQLSAQQLFLGLGMQVSWIVASFLLVRVVWRFGIRH